MTDLPIVTQDPRFGGGAATMLDSFRAATTGLGYRSRTLYLRHPGLRSRDPGDPAVGPGLEPPFGRLDMLNQLWGARRLRALLPPARAMWVVAATAHYGAAAVQADLPYGCWVATALSDEWRPQLTSLPWSRRLARLANWPSLTRLERQVLRRAQTIHTISPSARTALAAAANLDEQRIRILRIPVDVARLQPVADSEFDARLATPTVVFIGRADDPRKNLPLLLEAWRTVLRARPEAMLRLVGRPVRTPPLTNVTVVGPVADVSVELRAATLFVLPSLQEGFGIVVAEALAAGVPVVTTPSGGPEELVRQSGGGRITPDFDPAELGRTILALLDAPDELHRMREAGRRYVEAEHHPDVFRARVADAIEEIGAG